ncbi:MAG TPA: hypothetical protein VD835_14100, partial [Pyrinomonadaceae bacterium]|nr:hypothetical protein [Pyrinomonadaceae bacterium]
MSQYIFAGLLTLAFAPACVPVESQPAAVSNVSNANAAFVEYETEAETVVADGQGDAALTNARRLDRESRSSDGQLAQLPPAEHMRRAAAYHANRAFSEAREH